jgi:hypothetical protein
MRMQSSDAVVMREEPFGGSAWGPELLFHCNGTTGFPPFSNVEALQNGSERTQISEVPTRRQQRYR